jgi:hypothetical protein
VCIAAQDDSVHCLFGRDNNIYSCRIFDQGLADGNSREVRVEGEAHNSDQSDDTVVAIRIRNASIPFIIERLFTRFPNVFRLVIEPNLANGLSRIQSGAFADGANLQWIMINHNPLTTIQANAFVGANSMRTLDLRNNQIERISVFAFNGLSSLRDLMLENNRIFQIQGNLFKPLTNIELIYLSNNQIESIEGRTFANNRQLRHIDITRNIIQEIESSIVENLENLEIFVAAENACVNDAWVEEPIETIREGLKICFENFEKVQ